LHPSVLDHQRQQGTARHSLAGESRLYSSRSSLANNDAATTTQARGFGKTQVSTSETTVVEDEQDQLQRASIPQIKSELLDLLPRMTGQDDEFRRVEQLVNALEEKYVPAQTLDFLNLALQGRWQLLFSTNLAAGRPHPLKFRLRELVQQIECQKLEGKIHNTATWDLAEAADGNFRATGTFTAECGYSINQGARLVVDLRDHTLRPARGSEIPADVPALVGLLHRAMPKEMFDPSDHAMDTTYLDADFRIARYTGPRMEGVRGIFIRQGTLEINPVGSVRT